MKTSVNTVIHLSKQLFRQSIGMYVKLSMVIILIFTSICLPFPKCYGQKDLNTLKGTVNIVNAPQGQLEPEAKPLDHQPYDVEIFKLTFDKPFMGKGKQVYSIRYYMKGGNDSMRYQKAWIGTDDNFDKATYQWVNDSTVSVIMSNTLTAIADTVKLYSDNGSSGIMTK
jgi:hypothetical protein